MTLKLVFLTFICMLIILLSGCGATTTSMNPAPSSNAKINIVAVENFYGELAQAIGGSRVKVTSIIAHTSVDPHDYEPTLQTARLINDGDVILYNGIGYDDWIKELLSSTVNSGNKTVIAVGSDVLGKQAGDNPHVWYDPETMPKLAVYLTSKLSQLDPMHADEYEQRANAYIKSLAPLTNLIQELRQPHAEQVATSEPVFDYMLTALNFRSIDPHFAKAIEENMDPAPRDLAILQTAINNKTALFFVQNIQADNPTVNHIVTLVKANKLPIILVSESQPENQNYLQWMTETLYQIQAAMAATKR